MNDWLEVSYYQELGLEPLEVMKRTFTIDELRGFYKGNIIKYLLRAGHKDPAEKDIEKAKNYAILLFETYEEETYEDEVFY